MILSKFKLPVILVLLVTAFSSCSKKDSATPDDLPEDSEQIIRIDRNFKSVAELEAFRITQAKLIGKDFTAETDIKPLYKKHRSGAKGKVMVDESDSELAYNDLGLIDCNFEYPTLKNSFPHLYKFSIFLSNTMSPQLGFNVLSSGEEILPGNVNSVTANTHIINGFGRLFDANMNYVYEERLMANGIVLYYKAYRAKVLVQRQAGTETIITARLSYIPIN